MRVGTLLLALASLPAVAHAGGGHFPTGARFAGMGNADITLTDLWCVSGNQAGLAGIEHPVAGAYYQQHWLVPDLAMQGLAFALPVGKGCFAASANSFGNTLYAQRNFALAYAMKLGEGLRVGVQLDYMDLRLGEGYGSTNAVTAEAGVQAQLTEHLWIGAHLYDPNRAALGGPYDEKEPMEISAGLGYTFSEQVVLTGEISKDIDRMEQFHAGIEYRPTSVLFLRTGISTGPAKAHFGAGIRLKRLDLDMAAVMRSQLGLTPMVNLNYRFQ
jgi:hypothetical protein